MASHGTRFGALLVRRHPAVASDIAHHDGVGQPPPPGDQMDTPQDTEELEDKYKEFASLPLLMLSLDQASSGWAAAHFLAAPQPGGMGLNVTFTADPFHRSWNDFKWACSRAKGHINHSMSQMTICYNANYGPWM